MTMIRGKIETDIELAPKVITSGNSPFYEKNGKWFHNDPNVEVIVTTMENLLREAGYDIEE